MSDNSCDAQETTITKRFNRFVEKFLWWIIGVVFTILSMVYNNTNERITAMEDKVTFLYQDKVSRAELREVTSDLRTQSETHKAEIIAQQQEMKADILARLDYLLRIYPTNPRGK